VPHRSVLLGSGQNQKRVHDAIYAERSAFPASNERSQRPRRRDIALILMLHLRLITRGCVAWRVAYIYPVTVYTVNSVSVRNSSGAKVNSACLMGLIRTEFENNNYLKGEGEEMTC
jgi:hypothetical protein